MRLPVDIEIEIQAIERDYGSRGGQHAGPPRLRGLRTAIQAALASSPSETGWRNEPILHELQMQNESTGETRAFIVEPHHPGQTGLRVMLGDGRYAITGIRHVRIIKERIVDAD